jgi:DNA replication and repair protein RecF
MSFNREIFILKQKSDLEQGRTEYGPHRADFKVLVKGKDGRHYASQGIRRIVAISFRLAQAELVGASTGQRPLLLLDDITSEIDPGRRRNLLKLVEQLKYQTILTTTERKLIEDGFEGEIRALEIQKGSVL